MNEYKVMWDALKEQKGEAHAQRVGALAYKMVHNYIMRNTNMRLLLGDVGGKQNLNVFVFSAYSTLPDPFDQVEINECNREMIYPVTNRYRTGNKVETVALEPLVFVRDQNMFGHTRQQTYSLGEDVAEVAISQLALPLDGSYIVIALEARAVSVSTQKFVKSLTPKELTLLSVAERTAVFDADWDGNFTYLARKTGQTRTQVRDLIYRIVQKLYWYGDVDVKSLSPAAARRWDSVAARVGG